MSNKQKRFTVTVVGPQDDDTFEYMILDTKTNQYAARIQTQKYASWIAGALNTHLSEEEGRRENKRRSAALDKREEELQKKEDTLHKERLSFQHLQDQKEDAENWQKLYSFMYENGMIPEYWD